LASARRACRAHRCRRHCAGRPRNLSRHSSTVTNLSIDARPKLRRRRCEPPHHLKPCPAYRPIQSSWPVVKYLQPAVRWAKHLEKLITRNPAPLSLANWSFQIRAHPGSPWCFDKFSKLDKTGSTSLVWRLKWIRRGLDGHVVPGNYPAMTPNMKSAGTSVQHVCGWKFMGHKATVRSAWLHGASYLRNKSRG